MNCAGVNELEAPLMMKARSMLEILHAMTKKVLNSMRAAITSFCVELSVSSPLVPQLRS